MRWGKSGPSDTKGVIHTDGEVTAEPRTWAGIRPIAATGFEQPATV